VTLYLQNSQSKIDWGCGSSSTAPALQVRSLSSKPHYTKKKKKKDKKMNKNQNKGWRCGSSGRVQVC
jgi:hypothetical protein